MDLESEGLGSRSCKIRETVTNDFHLKHWHRDKLKLAGKYKKTVYLTAGEDLAMEDLWRVLYKLLWAYSQAFVG